MTPLPLPHPSLPLRTLLIMPSINRIMDVFARRIIVYLFRVNIYIVLVNYRFSEFVFLDVL